MFADSASAQANRRLDVEGGLYGLAEPAIGCLYFQNIIIMPQLTPQYSRCQDSRPACGKISKNFWTMVFPKQKTIPFCTITGTNGQRFTVDLRAC
jgi:hypothetical protein